MLQGTGIGFRVNKKGLSVQGLLFGFEGL